jgi:2-phospho-L-lactate guanylyltransferase
MHGWTRPLLRRRQAPRFRWVGARRRDDAATMDGQATSRERTTTVNAGRDGAVVVAVVAMKPLERAKSRLAVNPLLRRQLALAMAVDTVSAALSAHCVTAVIGVTNDPDLARHLHGVGAIVIADRPARGLNSALRYGVAAAARHAPQSAVITLAGDLPALRPDQLDATVRQCPSIDRAAWRAVVPDLSGQGTTMLAASAAELLLPRMGPGSLHRHENAGFRVIADAPVGLRCDVDTVTDLTIAAANGVGPATLEVLNGNACSALAAG